HKADHSRSATWLKCFHFALIENDRITGRCRNPRAGSNSPGEVEGVGGRQDERLLVRLGGGGAEEGNDFRQGVLLPCDAGDESAAANFPTGFQPATGSHERMPRRRR